MRTKEFRHEMEKLDIKKYNGLSEEKASKIEKSLMTEQLAEIIASPQFQNYYGSYKAKCKELDFDLKEILENKPDLPLAQIVYLAPYVKDALLQMKDTIGTSEYAAKFEIEDRLYEHYNAAVMKLLKNETLNIQPHEFISMEDTIDYLIRSYDSLLLAVKENNRERIIKILASQALPNFDLLLHM